MDRCTTWSSTAISRSDKLRAALASAATSLDAALDAAAPLPDTADSHGGTSGLSGSGNPSRASSAEGGEHGAQQHHPSQSSQPRRTHWVEPSDGPTASLLEDLGLAVLKHHCDRLGLPLASHGVEWWVRTSDTPIGTRGPRRRLHEPGSSAHVGDGDPHPHCGSSEAGVPSELPAPHRPRERGPRTQPSLQGSLQFHFDKDEEIYSAFRKYFHPVLATVTYLAGDDDAAPTVILPIIANEGGAVSALPGREATVSWPRPGKHLCFPGGWLHGVPPSLACEPRPQPQRGASSLQAPAPAPRASVVRRTTFMANVWQLDQRPVRIERLGDELQALAPRRSEELEGIPCLEVAAPDDPTHAVGGKPTQPRIFPFRQARLQSVISSGDDGDGGVVNGGVVVATILGDVRLQEERLARLLGAPVDEIVGEVDRAFRRSGLAEDRLAPFTVRVLIELVVELRVPDGTCAPSGAGTVSVSGDAACLRPRCTVSVSAPTCRNCAVLGETLVCADVTNGLERIPVPVFDQWASGEDPTTTFVYTVHSVGSGGVDLPGAVGSLDRHGCACDARSACTDTRHCACAPASVASGDPVYECSAACACAASCPYRATQRGVAIPTHVFRTKDRGWGLRAADDLPEGTFCLAYNGEVLKRAAAQARLRITDTERGSNYLLVLAEHAAETVYKTHIDAGPIGSLARFINHSCDPNLEIRPVRTDSIVPVAALFTRRRVVAGEELTFAYGDTTAGGVGNRVGTAPCHCGALACAGALPSQSI